MRAPTRTCPSCSGSGTYGPRFRHGDEELSQEFFTTYPACHVCAGAGFLLTSDPKPRHRTIWTAPRRRPRLRPVLRPRPVRQLEEVGS